MRPLINLKNLNDKTLIEKTEYLVRAEREILIKVLHHLREIDRRRLYSALGYKSLFYFTTKHLGYPEDQAYRRISAMKLLKEIPEIVHHIQAGEISLTHIGLAQSLFRHERKIQRTEMTYDQKLSVIAQIANKPVREAERITSSLSSAPEIAKPDRINVISDRHVEMKFTAPIDLPKKVEQLKGWLAHKYPKLSHGELFDKLCDLGLNEWNPAKMQNRKIAAPRKRSVIQPKSQAQIRREVFQKADTQCENCGSSHALEIDHIQPRALGGNSSAENLRLLCRSCNQRAAIKKFGVKHMGSFIND